MEKQTSGVQLKGRIKMEVYRDGELIDTLYTKNLIVNQGLEEALDSTLLGGAQISTWYVGLLDNYTPLATTTPANISVNEVTAYSEATRPTYVGVRTNQTVSNTASKAQFTINAGATSVYGACIISSNVKAGSSGVLFAAGLFGTPRTGLAINDELYITYDVTAATA